MSAERNRIGVDCCKILLVDGHSTYRFIGRARKWNCRDRYWMKEYGRPWKVSTLAIGITLLVAGSYFYQAPDWDIPISFIMALLAYFTAPWSLRVILERRWRLWPAALFAIWFTVDGCYAIYRHFKNPIALEQMRAANFPASLALYGICGVIWLYRGSLAELRSELLALIGNQNT